MSSPLGCWCSELDRLESSGAIPRAGKSVGILQEEIWEEQR